MLFIVGVVMVLIAFVIIPRMRVPGGVNSATLGWMSEQWSGVPVIPDGHSLRFYEAMAHNSSRPYTTAALLDDEPDVLRYATCPMCRTPTSLTHDAIEAGGDWRCVRCGQRWDAVRLATVAAYATWTVDRDRVARRGTEGRQDAALYRDSPTERLDGRP